MLTSAMENYLSTLKRMIKDLERNSKECEKEEKLEILKIKEALQKGDMVVARIHAENAIRQKKQMTNYSQMQTHFSDVAKRI